MAISDQQRDKLNNVSPVCRDVKLGTESTGFWGSSFSRSTSSLKTYKRKY